MHDVTYQHYHGHCLLNLEFISQRNHKLLKIFELEGEKNLSFLYQFRWVFLILELFSCKKELRKLKWIKLTFPTWRNIFRCNGSRRSSFVENGKKQEMKWSNSWLRDRWLIKTAGVGKKVHAKKFKRTLLNWIIIHRIKGRHTRKWWTH